MPACPAAPPASPHSRIERQTLGCSRGGEDTLDNHALLEARRAARLRQEHLAHPPDPSRAKADIGRYSRGFVRCGRHRVLPFGARIQRRRRLCLKTLGHVSQCFVDGLTVDPHPPVVGPVKRRTISLTIGGPWRPVDQRPARSQSRSLYSPQAQADNVPRHSQRERPKRYRRDIPNRPYRRNWSTCTASCRRMRYRSMGGIESVLGDINRASKCRRVLRGLVVLSHNVMSLNATSMSRESRLWV